MSYRTRVEYCTKTGIGIRKRGQHFKKSPLPPISGKFDPKGKISQDLGIKSEILGAFCGRHEEQDRTMGTNFPEGLKFYVISWYSKYGVAHGDKTPARKF